MVQGALGGFIFWALDIPGPVLWGVVMTVLSLIPIVGASLIWLPVGLYLLATGATTDGIILIAFGAIVIGLVDNILRPILVGRDTKMPDYLILLSTLGGFSVFGMTGFVLGPLIAALFLTFWEIFTREFNVLNSDNQPNG
jgi:predicted PurR-regulated permease PerM